ncbi:trypsin 5G1-like [Pararge aegeria]|uniref:Jg27185 protein n=1 Tax=Pararge aegeria aegeria TaxID=348720 RepID=A0A8S4SR46_9NEOP|nr:trypsin 5G1-like [Pararge aegeria]CAH2268858.1 jg27185 [Pararge aegeria aegeria]
MLLFTLVQILSWLTLAACEGVQIIGGEPIGIQKAPYMALFRPVGVRYYCGASIVSDQFLVTAAHCVSDDEKMEVTVGTNNASSGGQTYQVAKMVTHPQFGDSQFNNDVAVVKLVEKIKFSDRVRPIKLAEAGLVIEDSAEFRIIGFGRTETGLPSEQLLSVQVPHVPPVNCSESHHGLITDQMICAGLPTKGGCMGDSGGPLVYGDKLIGVVSFGSMFCNVPSVFARISALRDFIDRVMGEN